MNGQFKRKFSKEEIDAIIYACKYYRDDATTEDDGIAGLSQKSKERRILTAGIDKLKDLN